MRNFILSGRCPCTRGAAPVSDRISGCMTPARDRASHERTRPRPHECHPRQLELVVLTLLKQTRGRADAGQVFLRCGRSCPRRGDGARVVFSRLALTEVTTSRLTADQAEALQRETSRARLIRGPFASTTFAIPWAHDRGGDAAPNVAEWLGHCDVKTTVPPASRARLDRARLAIVPGVCPANSVQADVRRAET